MNEIITGDAATVLKTLPDNYVDCIITSPPYYGLRDYGNNNQIGLESTLDEYLNKLLEVTLECKRILKPSGTLWWNHGDSYGGSCMTGGDSKKEISERMRRTKVNTRVSQKSLAMTPYRLALHMVDEQGWILRNQIIWHKPNCMPSSVKDRFTVDYEPVFFFTKNKKYYFKQLFDVVGEETKKRYKYEFFAGKDAKLGHTVGRKILNSKGRNKRCVWAITTKPFKESHFATFPEGLVLLLIEAGCPEGGIVLDPFAGAGTTLLVAKKMGRQYIGIELNPEYIDMAQKRLAQIPDGLL
jgi:DNA modification methylase